MIEDGLDRGRTAVDRLMDLAFADAVTIADVHWKPDANENASHI
jgi:hypothetical protein